MNKVGSLSEGRDEFLKVVAEAVTSASDQDSRVAVICVDIDNFKDINFSAGYRVGDQVLMEISKRLVAALRSMDIVRRIGDDEFAVLLPSVLHQDHAVLAAHKILRTLDEHINAAGHEFQIRVSIGISVYPDTATQPEELLQQATMAMCRAKETRMGYAPYIDTGTTSRMTATKYMRELRRAISDNELELYYQAKRDFQTGEICGAEALTRWPHPDYGFISPEEFIPVAEQTGFIRDLTLWALNSALRQSAIWRKNKDFTVSVNVSARDLLDPNLPDLVQRAINTWSVDPSRLTLEITETAMMQDRKSTLDVLNRLSSVGLSLSIDDFGSGYSSLTYLQKLPVKELKIEKDFVVTMAENESDSIIVQTVVDLGHNFNLKVTAEGVETQETYNLLKSMGCDMAQGYFISQPMPAEEFETQMNMQIGSSP
ncbi:putative bifunctional diguanylate cyclase/phosphodiesterase [Pseudomonadota bacterium]